MTKTESTLADILACLRDQKKEIENAKNETNGKIEDFMREMNTNLTDVKREVFAINGKMEERERESSRRQSRLEDKLRENENVRKEEQIKINSRMSRMEEAMRRANFSRMKNPGLRQMEESEDQGEDIPPPRRPTFRENSRERYTGGGQSDWRKNANDELREAAEMSGRPNVQKQRHTESCNVQPAPRRIEAEKVKKPGGMKAIRKWFAQESPDGSEVSSESGTSGNESEAEVINRRERNRNRRKRNHENRKNKKAEAAKKASHTIGCQPISEADIEAHRKKTNDIVKARELAARDFLKNYLQFTDEELKDVTIMETKVSPKGDKTLYIAFKDIRTIKDIHWRAGEIKNPAIGIRNYIPPQFWQRYMFINRECARYREQYPEVKTQLRFGQRDVEILLKTRGTEEAYRNVTFDTITDPREIPAFEHNVKWQQRPNRSPRRKLVVHQQVIGEMEVEENNSGNLCGLLRQRSTDSSSGMAGNIETKKMKRNSGSPSADSSRSGLETEEDI